MGRLGRVGLGRNRVKGVGAMELWDLPQGRVIDLRDNRIAGELPILNLPNLKELMLSNNQITSMSNLNTSRLPSL